MRNDVSSQNGPTDHAKVRFPCVQGYREELSLSPSDAQQNVEPEKYSGLLKSVCGKRSALR
eukprot:15437975-Heterocapsa_arctica.AAC.1